jgi:hypothetical protein
MPSLTTSIQDRNRLAAKSRPAPAAPPALVEFVDFKWLMAGEGHLIDLDRLQGEPAYARGCMSLARGSTSATLQRVAERLAQALGYGRPASP